jgi:myo-inositol-1(or 4)-monophosphatase
MVRAAEQASKRLIRDFGEVAHLQVSIKGPGNFVSAADKKAESILFDLLTKARPEYGFLGEEGNVKEASDPQASRWIVDPLDGTSNFLHAIPHWAISIALERGGRILAGVIFDPIKQELFYAEKGGGAFLNGRRLRVSARDNYSQAMVSCNMRPSTPAPNWVQQAACARSFGSIALDLAYVAAGRLDALWQENIQLWDLAAGILLVCEAGGIVHEPSTLSQKQCNVFASNASLFKPNP